LYFGLLAWFFLRTARANPGLAGQPMRLVLAGFTVLWLTSTIAASIQLLAPRQAGGVLTYLREGCESGAMFLLGFTLVAYGLMLWIPQVLASHAALNSDVARQRNALVCVESARTQLEHRLIEADRRGILGELAATIAHDLRNPLAIVKGTAESLCRRPRTPTEVEEHTQVIRRSIDKADKTIAALIDLGKPRTTASRYQAVTPLLDELRDLVAVEARRRRLEIQVRAGRGDDRAAFDRTLTAQAVLNLVLNAMQAAPAGSRIEVGARRFAGADGSALAIFVADRGCGLPPDWRTRLFTAFFTTKPEGTGLGLSSCRRIAKELGGSVRVHPRHRGGARAVLLLPAGERPVEVRT
jgi:signal transduction histidine kinase